MNELCKPACKLAWLLGPKSLEKLEAWPRIELGCADLQSAASPLRHQAAKERGWLSEAFAPGKE